MNRKQLRPLRTLALALGLALVAPALHAGFGSSNTCVAVRPSGGGSCSANDLTFVLIGLGVQSDGCVNDSDLVTIELGARIRNTTAQTRYDVGIFIDRNNVSAYSGSNCAVEMLHPVGQTGNFSCTTGTPPLSLNDTVNAAGPFLNTDGDACGDLQNQSGTGCDISPVDGNYDDSFIKLPPLTLSCRAANPTNDGFVRLATCLTYGNNNDQVGDIIAPNKVCGSENDLHAGTPSKCKCDDSQITNIPLPNLRLDCNNFLMSRTLDPNVAETFTIDYTNSVPGCTPGPITDPFGRFRCGTASFVRFVVSYGNAGARGNFTYNDGSGDVAIPACTAGGTLASSAALVCNDAANTRLIFAPRDSVTNPVWGVVSPFAGSKSLPFKYTLTDTTSTAGVSFSTRIFWSNDINTNANGAIETSEAMTPPALVETPQTCGDCACTMNAATTPVTLASFRAMPSGHSVRFDWSTETEVGNVGFDLYARVDDDKVRLNDEPIPTHGADSLTPQSYSVELPVPQGAEEFYIEDIDLGGVRKEHGPFKQGKRYGQSVVTEDVDWASVRREHGLAKSGNARPTPRGQSAKLARATTSTAAAATAGASGPIELHLERSGIYRITYEQLAGTGFDLSGETASQLALAVRGSAVPMRVVTGGKQDRFGPGSYFEFWGEGLGTLYTKANVYRLSTGQRKPLRMSVSTTAPSGVSPGSYAETRRFEKNKAYAYWSPGEDPFYDTQMLVFSTPKQWSFPFVIDGLVAGAGAASISVDVYGGTSFPEVDPDHHVQFLVNGTFVGEVRFDGTNGVRFVADVPDGVLVDGSNTLVLRLPSVPGIFGDLSVLDGFSVTYPRTLAAIGDGLAFGGAGGRFDVVGLSSADVVGYRRDGASVTHLAGLQLVADGGGYRAAVPGSGAGAQYIVAGAAARLSPTRIQSSRPAIDLVSGTASYLVVSHEGFLAALDPLVAARASQGHSVKVVDVEDVYSQFAGGVLDPEAIRAYIAQAARTMGTRYVLLVGGDTYDYHDYLNLAPVSFLPSLYRETDDAVRYAPSDSSYADVDGDGIQDLAIGRIPARTPQELANVVNKILQYESNLGSPKGIFIADLTDPGSTTAFRAISDGLIADLPAEWQAERIYLDSLSIADARSKFFTDIASGAALTQFLGHSGLTSWGSPGLGGQRFLTVNDVGTLANTGRPTAVVQLGCWNSYFVHPQTESIGSRLLLAPDRGAAAVMGAAALSADRNNNQFAELLAPLLAEPGMTIGDAILQAKRALPLHVGAGVDLRDIQLGWTLLGDPALRATP